MRTLKKPSVHSVSSVAQCFHMPRQILAPGPGCLHQGVQSARDQGMAAQVWITESRKNAETRSFRVPKCFHVPRQILTPGPGCFHQGIQAACYQGVAAQVWITESRKNAETRSFRASMPSVFPRSLCRSLESLKHSSHSEDFINNLGQSGCK